jgi:hypothetical protein
MAVYLSIKLIKVCLVREIAVLNADLLSEVYGPNTFNRVGASKEIIRIYKVCIVDMYHFLLFSLVEQYFLAVFVSFQVSALLLISAIALWLDQLVNTDNAIAGMTYHKNLYLALSIFTLAVRFPLKYFDSVIRSHIGFGSVDHHG